MTQEQRIAALIKNGITPEDLEAEWHNGYETGHREASPNTFKTCFAAFCLALRSEFGFGTTRIIRALNAADNLIVNYLTTSEIIEAAYKQAGVAMDFQDGIEKFKERDGDKPWRHAKK